MGCRTQTELQSVAVNRTSYTLPGADHGLSRSIQPGHPEVERERGQPQLRCSKALASTRAAGTWARKRQDGCTRAGSRDEQ